MKRRAFLAAALFLLAACGGGPPPAPLGTVVPARFSDAKPVEFGRPRPQQMAVQGIDAARFQKHIDWREARRNGVNFAFLKATEGGDIADPMFDSHWRGARQAGVARGAYHFYYFCTTPEVQARWFIRNVPRTTGMLPPVLDMEWNPLSPTCAHLRPPADEVHNQMRRWLSIVEAHYGQRPIIYTTPKFYSENRLGSFKGYEFWLRSTAKPLSEAFPGQNWRFWQYSATGRIGGIAGDVDLNAFQGGAEAWNAWLATRQVR